MQLKPGSRWKSAVCDAQLVVVRPPNAAGELQCGGAPVLPIDDASAPSGNVSADFAEGVMIGKRYTDEASGIDDPVIWTDKRDQEMWAALQGGG